MVGLLGAGEGEPPQRPEVRECAVRHDGAAAGEPGVLACGGDDRTGDRVQVVRGPRGLVGPEFEEYVSTRTDADLVMGREIFLLAVSFSVVAIGAVSRYRTRRRETAASGV